MIEANDHRGIRELMRSEVTIARHRRSLRVNVRGVINHAHLMTGGGKRIASFVKDLAEHPPRIC